LYLPQVIRFLIQVTSFRTGKDLTTHDFYTTSIIGFIPSCNVFAAGNEYAAMAGYPGAYPDYISVAALAADGTPSCYSNYAMGVSIAAPGGDSDYHQSSKGKIYSTLPPSANEDGGENSHYGYMEGTSQACPHISGVAALGLSYAAELHRHFRADEFRKMILESVNPVEPYFKETKVYWYTNASFGQIAAGQMEL